MFRHFTRRQLYDLVWSKPMTHVANEFGLSDVALHKHCRSHNVPKPPLGWWAKKQAGKPVTQAPLPPLGKGEIDKISIMVRAPSSPSNELVSARDEARSRALEKRATTEQVISPFIARTIARLRKARPNEKGLVERQGSGHICCHIAPASIDRIERVLPLIANEAALQGFKLVNSDDGVAFQSSAQTISFSVFETVRREKHVLTDMETATLEEWDKKQEKRSPIRRLDFMFDRPRFQEWDFVQTGQLAIEFETIGAINGQAPRRSFRDTRTQSLEAMAPVIGVGLAVLAAAKTEEIRRREELERKRDEERRLQEIEKRAEYVEGRRTKYLNALLTEIAELDRLRRLIGLLSSEIQTTSSPRASELLSWMQSHIHDREAYFSPAVLESDLEEQNLFGGDDDRGFFSPSWYGRY